MRLYRQNYDGIDLMCDYIVKALGYLEYEQILQHLHRYTNTWGQQNDSNLWKRSNMIKNWDDVFMSQRSYYLRLTISLDISITIGKFRSAADIPASLRARITAKAKFPIYMTLNSTPSPSHEKCAEDRGRFSSIKDQGRRVCNEISLYNWHGSTIKSINETEFWVQNYISGPLCYCHEFPRV